VEFTFVEYYTFWKFLPDIGGFKVVIAALVTLFGSVFKKWQE
jgi:hypothetical protein